MTGDRLVLRTRKSDVVTGPNCRTADELDPTGTAWRTSGTHALNQVRG